MNEGVLARAGRYQIVAQNLQVEEVCVGNRRYVVYRNPLEAEKDKIDRESLVEKLERTLAKQGPKAVVGNREYARFLTIAKDGVSVNREAIKQDARLDGAFVLSPNTDMSARDMALNYESLWTVARIFREQKSTLEIRPIYHHRDGTSTGHIVSRFLGLRLEVDLQRRLSEKGTTVAWQELMRDLARVQSVIIELDGTRHQLSQNLVLTLDLGFKRFDTTLIPALLAVGLTLKGSSTMLEKLLLPPVRYGRLKPQLIPQIRHRNLVDQMAPENPNLLLSRVILAAPHASPSVVL